MIICGDEQEHTQLGWRIIEWKVAYYKPECVHPQRRKDYEISDDDYDAAEVRYLTLTRILQQRRAADTEYHRQFPGCEGKYPANSVVHKKWPGFEDVGYEEAMMEVDETRPSVQLVMAKLGSPKPRKRKRK